MNRKCSDSGIFIILFYRKEAYKFSWIREDMKINVFQLNSQVGQFYSSVQGMQK